MTRFYILIFLSCVHWQLIFHQIIYFNWIRGSGIFIMRRFSVTLQIEGIGSDTDRRPNIWNFRNFSFSVLTFFIFSEEQCISSRTLMFDGIPPNYCKKDLIIRHFQEAYPTGRTVIVYVGPGSGCVVGKCASATWSLCMRGIWSIVKFEQLMPWYLIANKLHISASFIGQPFVHINVPCKFLFLDLLFFSVRQIVSQLISKSCFLGYIFFCLESLLESCEVIPIGPIGPLGECPVRSRPVHCISFLSLSTLFKVWWRYVAFIFFHTIQCKTL